MVKCCLLLLSFPSWSLVQVIEAPLPNAPPDASVFSHWLAIDGIQPSIPQNSPLQGISFVFFCITYYFSF